MVRRSVSDDSYGRGPFPRPIERREVQSLPRAEFDLTVAHREGHAVADKDRFDMSGAVSFGVFVFRVAGNHPLERGEDVFLHVGVGVLVHEDRRRRVRDGHGHQPLTYFRPRDRSLHPWGDIDRLLAPLRLHRDRFVSDAHARAATTSRCAAIRAMSSAVAFPPLTMRTVRRPRTSTLPARTAASGAAPAGSAKSHSAP